MAEVTRILSHKGATIQQLNTVRKHLECLKGGGLAKVAAPAKVRTSAHPVRNPSGMCPDYERAEVKGCQSPNGHVQYASNLVLLLHFILSFKSKEILLVKGFWH